MGQSGRLATEQGQGAARSEAPPSASAIRSTWDRRFETWQADLVAIGILLVSVIVVVVFRWLYPNWLIDPDIYTMFLPWFGYIGDRSAEFQAAVNAVKGSGRPSVLLLVQRDGRNIPVAVSVK